MLHVRQEVEQIKVDEKLVLDHHFGRIDVRVVSDVLKKMGASIPFFRNALTKLEKLYFVNQRGTFEQIMQSIITKEDCGKLFADDLNKIYTYDKPDGYSVRGIAFAKHHVIMINLHQIFQCATELERYLNSDEKTRQRNHRYFSKDCHYDNFDTHIKTKEDAVNFLFWNTLFEQLRSYQQSIETVDYQEYNYKEERSEKVNDMIGFAKFSYIEFVGDNKVYKG